MMPRYKKITDLLHSHGVDIIFLDSDGNVEQLIPLCLDDDKEALRILDTSLPAQRNDPLIINNYACSLARSGDVAAAIEALDKVKFPDLEDWQKLTLAATQGLIYFRTDNIEQGRESYSLAIRGFEKINDNRSAAIAAYYLAFEEKRIQSPYVSKRVKEAKSRIIRFNVFEIEDLAKKL